MMCYYLNVHFQGQLPCDRTPINVLVTEKWIDNNLVDFYNFFLNALCIEECWISSVFVIYICNHIMTLPAKELWTWTNNFHCLFCVVVGRLFNWYLGRDRVSWWGWQWCSFRNVRHWNCWIWSSRSKGWSSGCGTATASVWCTRHCRNTITTESDMCQKEK